jgi:4-diphosphocytidyl-2-C-methyl-D-erythritol kinase
VALVLPAYAKINLDLRVLGVRADGYHDLKTVFQSLALHDEVTFKHRKGAFAIECDDPRIPVDQHNLVWRAASLLWRTAGNRRSETPRDVVVQLRKRIPAAAGLGGGSANAAAALVGLARVWNLDVDMPTLSRLAAGIGADVPFFLVGGTALGLGRGDDIYPLVDLPRTYIVIVRPHFGVSTAEAYGWYDAEPRRAVRESAPRPRPEHWPEWAFNLRNDLESAVVRHHPAIGRIKQALIDAGAVVAAMSGSGSAVFGLFERLDAARRTAADLARHDWHVLSTRTLSRSDYAARLRPMLARTRKRRIS